MSIKNDFFAGIVAGSTGTLAGYPFDVIKTYSQADQRPGMIETSKYIYNKHGLLGFYKGVMSPLTCRAIIKGTLFASYEKVTKLDVLKDTNKYLKMSIAG